MKFFAELLSSIGPIHRFIPAGRVLVLGAVSVALVAPLSGCKKKEEAAAGASGDQPAAEAPAAAEPTFEFKTKWPVGNRYTYRVDSTVEMEGTLPNRPDPVKFSTVGQTAEFALSVLTNREGGVTELELEYLSEKMDVRSLQASISFDSKSPSKKDLGNPMVIALKKLPGLKVKYLTDATGKIDKVEDHAELAKKTLQGVATSARPMLTSLISEDNLKRQATLIEAMPEKAVKAGDSWPYTDAAPISGLGQASITAQYTFKEFQQRAERKCALFEFSGTFEIKQGPARTAMTLEDGKVSGQTWFDAELGGVVESSTELSGKITQTGQGGQSITMQMTQKVATRLAELNGTPLKVSAPAAAKPEGGQKKKAKAAEGGEPKGS